MSVAWEVARTPSKFAFATIAVTGLATINPYPYAASLAASLTPGVPADMTLAILGLTVSSTPLAVATVAFIEQGPFGTATVDAFVLPASSSPFVRGYNHHADVFVVHAGATLTATVTGTVTIALVAELVKGRR